MREFLAVLACVGLQVGAACAQGPALRIRVLDYARLPADTLRNFQVPAREIYQESGIDAAWPVCRIDTRQGACGPLADDQMYIKIVGGPARSALGGKIRFGTTIRQGTKSIFAYVFWQHVQQAAKRLGMPASLLLGDVIAHETGHLLGLDHTAGGIMNCDFDVPERRSAEQGELLFSRNEANALREALSPNLAQVHP